MLYLLFSANSSSKLTSNIIIFIIIIIIIIIKPRSTGEVYRKNKLPTKAPEQMKIRRKEAQSSHKLSNPYKDSLSLF